MQFNIVNINDIERNLIEHGYKEDHAKEIVDCVKALDSYETPNLLIIKDKTDDYYRVEYREYEIIKDISPYIFRGLSNDMYFIKKADDLYPEHLLLKYDDIIIAFSKPEYAIAFADTHLERSAYELICSRNLDDYAGEFINADGLIVTREEIKNDDGSWSIEDVLAREKR